MVHAYETSEAHLNGKSVREKNDEEIKTHLTGADRDLFIRGKEIYARDGYCATCHQPGGEGLSASGFPPLSNTSWVIGNEERLIKIALKGLLGPIEVSDKKYPGQVPMTPFEGLLKDDEVAAVLTYVRNSFGNKSSVITPEKVKAVREKIKSKTGFYSPDRIIKRSSAGEIKMITKSILAS